MAEVSNLRRCAHRNVLPLLGYCGAPQAVCLVTSCTSRVPRPELFCFVESQAACIVTALMRGGARSTTSSSRPISQSFEGVWAPQAARSTTTSSSRPTRGSGCSGSASEALQGCRGLSGCRLYATLHARWCTPPLEPLCVCAQPVPLSVCAQPVPLSVCVHGQYLSLCVCAQPVPLSLCVCTASTSLCVCTAGPLCVHSRSSQRSHAALLALSSTGAPPLEPDPAPRRQDGIRRRLGALVVLLCFQPWRACLRPTSCSTERCCRCRREVARGASNPDLTRDCARLPEISPEISILHSF